MMVSVESKSDTYYATDYEGAVRYIEHCEQSKTCVVYVDWTKNAVSTSDKAPNISTGVQITRPGAFRKGEDVYIVKPNKERTRLYALKLVEAPSHRLTVDGRTVDFEFEYAKGAIYKLTEADRMSIEEAEKLSIMYGKCIICGRRLKVAESIKRGIGPVCAKIIAGEY